MQGKDNINRLARTENVRKSSLDFWLKLYDYYGEQVLLGVSKGSCTVEEKVHIIQEHQNSELSFMDT